MAESYKEGIAFCSHCDWHKTYNIEDPNSNLEAAQLLGSHAKQCALNPLVAEVQSLRLQVHMLQQENENFKTCGIVEIAVRNPNVASYVKHWEERAVNAEIAIIEGAKNANKTLQS